jgi:hypothetical protein
MPAHGNARRTALPFALRFGSDRNLRFLRALAHHPPQARTMAGTTSPAGERT